MSRRQTNNPVLRFIRNVPWEYAEIVPDYQMGTQTCCLFLRCYTRSQLLLLPLLLLPQLERESGGSSVCSSNKQLVRGVMPTTIGG